MDETRAVRYVLNANIIEINSSFSSATTLIKYLKDVLDDSEEERINNRQAQSCTQDAVELLVDILGKKDGRVAFPCFLNALKKENKEKLLDNLLEQRLPKDMQAEDEALRRLQEDYRAGVNPT